MHMWFVCAVSVCVPWQQCRVQRQEGAWAAAVAGVLVLQHCGCGAGKFLGVIWHDVSEPKLGSLA